MLNHLLDREVLQLLNHFQVNIELVKMLDALVELKCVELKLEHLFDVVEYSTKTN